MLAEALPPTGLPVEDVVALVRRSLAEGSTVLQAAPGAGKTTVVPLRLLNEPWLGDGRIVVLEPRRVAARAAATRMAALLGQDVGATVGYVTRDGRRTSSATRVEVVTDGVLTRRLQNDPSLPGTALVVFDEIHERHLQSDLGLALTLEARDALRPDLRILAMSATLDAQPLAALLGGATVVTSPGRQHPVQIRWTPSRPNSPLSTNVAGAVRQALETDAGDVLVFVPGIGEIRAVTRALGHLERVAVLPLHGGLSLRAGGARNERSDHHVDPGPLLARAYPDRVAQWRGGDRYRLRHGGGAVLPDHDPLAGSEWLVAADVSGAAAGPGGADGLIRLAAPLDQADVERVGGERIRTETELRWDPSADDLRAITTRRLDALILETNQGSAQPGAATTKALVARAVERQLADLAWTPAARGLQARVAWAHRTLGDGWPDVGDAALAATADDWLARALSGARGRRDLERVDPVAAIRTALGGRVYELDRLLPTMISLPGGRRLPVDYRGERPRVSARARTSTAWSPTRRCWPGESRSRWNSCRLRGGPSRSRLISPASGPGPGAKCAKRWPAAIRGIRGPITRGPRPERPAADRRGTGAWRVLRSLRGRTSE